MIKYQNVLNIEECISLQRVCGCCHQWCLSIKIHWDEQIDTEHWKILNFNYHNFLPTLDNQCLLNFSSLKSLWKSCNIFGEYDPIIKCQGNIFDVEIKLEPLLSIKFQNDPNMEVSVNLQTISCSLSVCLLDI